MNRPPVDPVLLAVSDLLVVTALERGFARVVPRSQRALAARLGTPRWRGYEQVPIAVDAVDKALTDAWLLCPMLADRHGFGIHVPSWVQLLDTYTRALVAMAQPHTPEQLRTHLEPLAHGPAAVQRALRAVV